MINEFQLKNFKAWQDTGPIKLKPLTVIFGGNSSGKSSIGHFLMALKQTVLLTDRKRALHLGDEHSLIDLGTYEECVHGHDLTSDMSFRIQWGKHKPFTVEDVLKKHDRYQGHTLELQACIAAHSKSGQPWTRSFSYRLLDDEAEMFHVTHRHDAGKPSLDCAPMQLVRAVGRGWPVEPPEKFYLFSDRTLSRYQNAQSLNNLALETETLIQSIYHLGPLRHPPKRMYPWSGDTPLDVGEQGELTIPAILAATAQGRLLNRAAGKRKQGFDEFIAGWLKDLGVIHEFRVQPVAAGRKEYEVLIKVTKASSEVKLTDVGFGISQVLPALVQAFYCPPDSTVWMEQPEIHLHPKVQSQLADAFISAVKASENGEPRNVQLLIESHSEHFLTRLQRRIAEQVISLDDVAIYFTSQDKNGNARLESLKIDMFGEIENWPDGFFGDEMEDISARTLAAVKHRRELKAQRVKEVDA